MSEEIEKKSQLHTQNMTQKCQARRDWIYVTLRQLILIELTNNKFKIFLKCATYQTFYERIERKRPKKKLINSKLEQQCTITSMKLP